MKTAQSIEEQPERKAARDNRAKGDGKDRDCNTHNTVPVSVGRQRQLPALKPWPKGVSGNPGGRPKIELASEIAKAVFEQNAEALYQAYRKAALKGNAYCFKELSDRAYGKMSERIEHKIDPIRELTDAELQDRLRQTQEKIAVLDAELATLKPN
jgi:hypothetical protein